MRGSLSEKPGAWHCHESEITLIKLTGKATIQALGSTELIGNEIARGNCGVTQVYQAPSEAVEVTPGTPHRAAHDAAAVARGTGDDRPPFIALWKQFYHMGVNGKTIPEGFPEWGAAFDDLPVTHDRGQRSFMHEWRPSFEGDSPVSGLMKNLTPMFADKSLGGGESVVLKRSKNVGTLFRTRYSTQGYSKPITVHGEYMLTVTEGALEMKVRGLVMNTVCGEHEVKLPTTVYSAELLKAEYENGFSTVVIPLAETILLHEGCQFMARGAVAGTVTVTNYLMADPALRGKETISSS